MKRISTFTFFFTLVTHFCFGQAFVKSLQPTMSVYYKAGYQVSDSVMRYFFTSSVSKHSSHHLTYFIDHNLLANSITTHAVLDSAQQFSALTAAYDLYHLGLPDGSSILGSNGFECDITISDLALVNEDGTTWWALTWNEIFFNEFITSIGLVEKEIIVVNTVSGLPFYFNLEGQQEFFGIDPPAYFNIVSTDNFFYGINAGTVYKLNDDFEIIDTHADDTIRFFQEIEEGLFLLATDKGISIVDTFLSILASSTLITNVLSVAKSGNHIWVVNPEGLHQLDPNLNIEKTFLPEAWETMNYVSTLADTVFVASEYNGIYHRDFVLRKYLPDQILSSLPVDIGISNVYLPDKIIRQPLEDYPYIFNLRFDTLGIEIFNLGEDIIHSCVINCDWRVSYDPGFFCAYYTHEWFIDTLFLAPGDSKLVQLDTFVPGAFYYGIIPNFCFWVDFPDEQPDVNPYNDMLCKEGEIISRISQVEDVQKIAIYPNPTVDQLTIQFESDEGIKIFFIYTISGELAGEFSTESDLVSISVKDLIPGIYFLMIPMKNKVEYYRFIKQ